MITGAAGVLIAAIAAGTLARPNRSQRSTIVTPPPAASAPGAAKTETAASPRPSARGGVADTRPDPLRTPKVSQAPRASARSATLTRRAPVAVGSPAGEFAP